ncbi:MAG: diguanylate cyclase [Marinobacter sp.]|uniref:sensor domain-containing diguanylate cyclase n=1 Tax=Marinobacter sp. TaxID=50741 RepID=UPI00299E6E43|nr:diguanylate cyclase [Marinobacter sp.]MDX1757107.1 diguanylate cyclase [Marinobacter sp.]
MPFFGVVWGVVLTLACLASLTANAENGELRLSGDVQELADHRLWYPLDASLVSESELLTALQRHIADGEAVEGTLTGRSGAFLARVPLSISGRQLWFVVPSANFIDVGLAYWQLEQGPPQRLAEFSQRNDAETPRLMHAQAFPLLVQEAQAGTLWLVVQAKHFPTPVSLTFYSQQAFFHHQALVNGVTTAAIVVMLTLAVLALVVYLRNGQRLTLYCAGYVGLHGLGWAAAAGALNALLAPLGVNPAYAGMYLFPFAIAFAGLFTRGLFNCYEQHPTLAMLLTRLAQGFTALGLIMLWLPFQATFYLSHLIALVWVPLSVWVGFRMLNCADFRAKYYLVGNLCYSLSLVYYMASHANLFTGLAYPAMVVVAALAVDCVCILLSLSEWLRNKQHEFARVAYEARIDPLTKVGNRILMNEKLAQFSGAYVVVFIDFDGVKSINDTLGHAAGDRFLSEAATTMRKRLGQKGEVYRTGGDEFVWLMACDSEAQLADTRRHVTGAIASIEAALQVNWPASGISYGLATSRDGRNTSECLAEADRKMYLHKASKKSDRGIRPVLT